MNSLFIIKCKVKKLVIIIKIIYYYLFIVVFWGKKRVFKFILNVIILMYFENLFFKYFWNVWKDKIFSIII